MKRDPLTYDVFPREQSLDESLGREIRQLRSIFWSDRDPEGRTFPSLADAYRRAGDLDQAFDLLKEGLDRHPEFATGHVVAAWLHRDRDQISEAEAAFRRVLELDEENVQALHGLGRILVSRGEVEEAGTLLTRATELGAATEADLVRGAAAPEEPEESEAGALEELQTELATDTGDPLPEAVDEAVTSLEGSDEEPSSLDPGDVEVGPTAAGLEGTDAGAVPEGVDVIDVDALAPEPAGAEAVPEAEEAAIDIEALAPDEPEAGAEAEELDALDVDALAPEPTGAEAVPEAEEAAIDIGALAPDEPEAGAEAEPLDALEIDALAPEPTEAEPSDETEEAELVDIGALAPDDEAAQTGADSGLTGEPEPVDIGGLAPEPAEAEDASAGEGSGAVDIGALAPEPAEVEAVPEVEEPEAVDVAALAPETAEGETVPEAEGHEADEIEPDPDERPEEEGDEEPVVALGAEEFRSAAGEPYEGPRTRTMAELYARQGLLDHAVEIYRHLVQGRPGEPELRSRLRELVARAEGQDVAPDEDVESVAREMSSGDHAESRPSPFTWAEEPPATAEGEGEPEEPVSAWFQELLAWTPQPESRPQAEAPPPHGDVLSPHEEDR